MSEGAVSALRAIHGICIDAMIEMTKMVFSTDPKSKDALQKVADLNVAFAAKIREIHLLAQNELEQIDK